MSLIIVDASNYVVTCDEDGCPQRFDVHYPRGLAHTLESAHDSGWDVWERGDGGDRCPACKAARAAKGEGR